VKFLGKGAASAVSSLSGVRGQVTAEIDLGTSSTMSKHLLRAISVQNRTLLVQSTCRICYCAAGYSNFWGVEMYKTSPSYGPDRNPYFEKRKRTRMWANVQRDGRPTQYRWRLLFNAAKFGQRPLLECHEEMLPRRETR